MGYRLARKAYGSEFWSKHPLRRQVWVIVPLPSGKVGQKGIWGFLAANLAQGSVRDSILQVTVESDRPTHTMPFCASTGMPSCTHMSICHIQTLMCINELLIHVFPFDCFIPFLPHLENTTWSLGPQIKCLFLFLIIAKTGFKGEHFPFYISL